MRLKKLKEKRNDLQAQMAALLDTASGEERALTEEETQQFDALESEIASVDSTISREERARALSITKTTSEKKDDPAAEEASEERAINDLVLGVESEERAQLTNGDNGAIVPVRIANRIISEVRDTVPFLQLADVIQTSGELAIPVYEEDAKNYIKADYLEEGTDVADNVGKFTSVNLKGFAFNALALISKKLKNNADINVSGFIVNQVGEAIGNKLETEFINGTTDKIEGILSVDKGITAASATAITYDDLVKLKHSLKQRFRKNAKWIMHPETYTAICQLKDGNGQPYFKEDEYKILGLQVIESDSMPTIAAGVKAVAIADLSGYTIKETTKVELQILKEKFATKGFIGVLAYADYDGKVSDKKKIRVLTMGA